MFSKNTSFWCIVVFLIVLMVIHHILNDKPLIEGQQNKGNVDMGDVSNIRISLKGPPGVVRQALSAETVPIEAVEEGRDAEETVSEEERVAAEEARLEAERVAAEAAELEAERIAAEVARLEAERIAAEEERVASSFPSINEIEHAEYIAAEAAPGNGNDCSQKTFLGIADTIRHRGSNVDWSEKMIEQIEGSGYVDEFRERGDPPPCEEYYYYKPLTLMGDTGWDASYWGDRGPAPAGFYTLENRQRSKGGGLDEPYCSNYTVKTNGTVGLQQPSDYACSDQTPKVLEDPGRLIDQWSTENGSDITAYDAINQGLGIPLDAPDEPDAPDAPDAPDTVDAPSGGEEIIISEGGVPDLKLTQTECQQWAESSNPQPPPRDGPPYRWGGTFAADGIPSGCLVCAECGGTSKNLVRWNSSGRPHDTCSRNHNCVTRGDLTCGGRVPETSKCAITGRQGGHDNAGDGEIWCIGELGTSASETCGYEADYNGTYYKAHSYAARALQSRGRAALDAYGVTVDDGTCEDPELSSYCPWLKSGWSPTGGIPFQDNVDSMSNYVSDSSNGNDVDDLRVKSWTGNTGDGRTNQQRWAREMKRPMAQCCTNN